MRQTMTSRGKTCALQLGAQLILLPTSAHGDGKGNGDGDGVRVHGNKHIHSFIWLDSVYTSLALRGEIRRTLAADTSVYVTFFFFFDLNNKVVIERAKMLQL